MAGKKIVHIEDDRNVFLLVKTILEKRGHQSFSALDALQGVTLVREHRPDLSILDIMMPAGGGVSVFERLRNLNTTYHIPILIYTATPLFELEPLIPFGPDVVYLQKPARPDDIAKIVEVILEPKP